MLMKSCVYVVIIKQTLITLMIGVPKKIIVEINEVIKAIEGHRNQIRQ